VESLSEMLQKYQTRLDHIPEDVRYIPEDGLCPSCDQLKRNHPQVNKVLAARQLQYFDVDTGRLVTAVPIPYCRCDQVVQEQAANQLSDALKRERDSNLPQSVRGSRSRVFLDATFENFTARSGSSQAFEIATDYTVGNAPPMLLLLGGPGTGKTHLLEAVGRQYLAQGNTVRYELVAHLLEKARSAVRIGAEQDVFASAYKADVLLLDDIGLEKPSTWVAEQISALVDERYRNKRLLVIATNEVYATIKNNYGERLASRLFDTASGTVAQVYLNCGDFRAGVIDD